MTEASQHRRLKAPQANGGTLIDPPLEFVDELLARNRDSLTSGHHATQEFDLPHLAELARRELLEAAFTYSRTYRDVSEPSRDICAPIILAGHQPQLFHPGVWYKNFVLGRIADEHRGTAVNLVIDSDAMRSSAIRVPTGTASDPINEQVDIDRPAPEIPYEERKIIDFDRFTTFAERAQRTIEPLVPNTFLRDFWPGVVQRAKAEPNLGLAISQARHIQEGRWGATTLELPQSRLGDFHAFRLFASHLLANAAQFRLIYNAAAAEYRLLNHVRSAAHPVPDLSTDNDWIEAPFWIWTTDNPRRRRVFVTRRENGLQLTDREGLEIHLGKTTSAVPEQLAELASRGIKLRTRALITTMFARLVLGDLFLHGIGGAKYDQVTDVIIRRFFGVEPPYYLAVTATLRLPIQRPSVTAEDLRVVDQRLRDLAFHPERSIGDIDPQMRKLVLQKEEWIAIPQTRANAKERCRAIRSINETLQPAVAKLREQLLAERQSFQHALRAEKVLNSREYAFCLYPAEQLRELLVAR
jgi:hypothetical protein